MYAYNKCTSILAVWARQYSISHNNLFFGRAPAGQAFVAMFFLPQRQAKKTFSHQSLTRGKVAISWGLYPTVQYFTLALVHSTRNNLRLGACHKYQPLSIATLTIRNPNFVYSPMHGLLPADHQPSLVRDTRNNPYQYSLTPLPPKPLPIIYFLALHFPIKFNLLIF